MNVVNQLNQQEIVLSCNAHIVDGPFNVGPKAGSINEIQDEGVISRSNKHKYNEKRIMQKKSLNTCYT